MARVAPESWFCSRLPCSTNLQPFPTLQGCAMSKIKDLTGQKFTRLTVLGLHEIRAKNSYWHCVCECGNKMITRSDALKSGRAKSCGCLHKESASNICKSRNTTHGKAGSKTYKIWVGMLSRCTNPNTNCFKSYGGRGISICERWRTFENFIADMGECPPGLSIDRIDVNGDYEPSNCRWADMKTQSRNKRKNRLLTHNNQTRCVAEWAEIYGVDRCIIKDRLRLGWDTQDALEIPVRHMNRSKLRSS